MPRDPAVDGVLEVLAEFSRRAVDGQMRHHVARAHIDTV